MAIIDRDPNRGTWSLRDRPKEYLENHRWLVLGDLKEDPPEKVCHNLRVTMKTLMGKLQEWGMWEDSLFIPSKIKKDQLPTPPKMEKGKVYYFRSWLHQKGNNDNRLTDDRELVYLGIKKAKAPGKKIYLFENIAGARESFTIFQLHEFLVGE